MSSDMISPSSSQIDNNSNNSSNDGNHNIADVLLYAESKITRKQAVREIGDVVLRANMKPRTVKHALSLLKVLLPPENTLPSTVDELFGAMLSSENDWRLAQYLIRHKQRPSFLSSPNTWSDYSNSNISLTAASSSSVPRNQELNTPVQSSSLFLPVSSSSSASESDSESSSSSSSSSSGSGSSDDEDDDDERNILLALQEAQQQRLVNASPLRPSTESADVEDNLTHVRSSNNNESSDQRSQIVSSSINRFPIFGSFKRQWSETSSEESGSEPDLYYSRTLLDDDSDNERSFYPISNNNNNNKSCCFEMNGCDLLDGGKRRRHETQ